MKNEMHERRTAVSRVSLVKVVWQEPQQRPQLQEMQVCFSKLSGRSPDYGYSYEIGKLALASVGAMRKEGIRQIW
jgi:hypothetical protein